MTARRFAAFSIEQLEKHFDESRKVLSELNSLATELQHRKSKRAQDLSRRVAQVISVFGNLETPEDDFPWSDYERSLTQAERACIVHSPSTTQSHAANQKNLWSQGLELARVGEHMLLPAIRQSIDENGISLAVNAEAFGLAMRLAAFEVRNTRMTRWPAFALLFRKLLGENAIPWLPALWLGALGLQPDLDIKVDLNDVNSFRELFSRHD